MKQLVPDHYWLVARDKPALLTHMMRFLAGDAHISFEGGLSDCRFPAWIPSQNEENTILPRNTLAPRQDFIILALEQDTVRPILDVVLPETRYKNDIVHIQIEQHGRRQFGCYDQFHPNCIVCYNGITPEFLEALKEKHILTSWSTPV